MCRFTLQPGGQGGWGLSKQERAAIPDRRAEVVPAEPTTIIHQVVAPSYVFKDGKKEYVHWKKKSFRHLQNWQMEWNSKGIKNLPVHLQGNMAEWTALVCIDTRAVLTTVRHYSEEMWLPHGPASRDGTRREEPGTVPRLRPPLFDSGLQWYVLLRLHHQLCTAAALESAKVTAQTYKDTVANSQIRLQDRGRGIKRNNWGAEPQWLTNYQQMTKLLLHRFNSTLANAALVISSHCADHRDLPFTLWCGGSPQQNAFWVILTKACLFFSSLHVKKKKKRRRSTTYCSVVVANETEGDRVQHSAPLTWEQHITHRWELTTSKKQLGHWQQS